MNLKLARRGRAREGEGRGWFGAAAGHENASATAWMDGRADGGRACAYAVFALKNLCPFMMDIIMKPYHLTSVARSKMEAKTASTV